MSSPTAPEVAKAYERSAETAKKMLECSDGYSWEEADDIYHTIIGLKETHQSISLPKAPEVTEGCKIADAIEKCDWSGPSIGNKAILQAAVQCLRQHSAPTAPEVADLIERLKKAQDWMREPDWAEHFGADDIVRWLNDRPTSLFLNAATALRSIQAERDRLAERVAELENIANVVRMSAGWQVMSDETKALIDAAITKAEARAND